MKKKNLGQQLPLNFGNVFSHPPLILLCISHGNIIGRFLSTGACKQQTFKQVFFHLAF